MANTSGYQLYWEALSGAIAPEMLLTEIGIDFDKIPVDMSRGEHQTPKYLSVNPTGQVPALRLPDGTVIGESAAIILAIGERHAESPLVPNAGDSDRPTFLYWLLFLATSMYMTFVRSNHPERFTTAIDSISPIREAALEASDRQFGVVNQAIQGDPYFLTRGFSALDMYLTMLTVWHPNQEALFARHKRIGAAVQTTLNRPACGRILSEHRAQASTTTDYVPESLKQKLRY